MGPSDPLGPGTWDQKGLSLFYALKTELHGDPRIGRKHLFKPEISTEKAP